jgi:hypothetical protein
MRIPFIHGPGTVGREDRLVRGCIALSLLLLAGFAVVMSGQPSVIAIAFLVVGLYFTVTATLGRDPLYVRFGIDTRTQAQLDVEPQDPGSWPPLADRWLDLRDSDADLHTGPTGSSRLGT